MIEVIGFLFLLGICAGSFVNALVWRVHEQSKTKTQTPKHKKATNYSILTGRSICPHCRHQLAAKDLVPLISWLTLRGRCRYCQKPISKQYPLIELAAGIIFALSFIFWPVEFSGFKEALQFVTWLLSSTGLLALIVYDFKWMLLPNRILYPTAFATIAGRFTYIGLLENGQMQVLLEWFLAVMVASGIFWIIFHISKGKWIGYGDVRLGIITGTLLATPSKSLLMIFMASILGTIFVLPGLLNGKMKMTAQIPFGPFLIIASFLVMLFGQSIIDWYVDFAV